MKYIIALCLLVSGMCIASPARAAVNVFACTPEWGALAKEIGGVHVEVDVATSPTQNVHYLRAKPSFLAKMRKAELVVCNGASLEIGWLPVLLQKAGSPKVQSGQPGNLMAADYVQMRDIPAEVDRSMGDVHPEGNPHVHLDPHNIMAVANVLAARLAVIDPEHKTAYEAQRDSFLKHWQSLTKTWEQQGASLKGMKVVVYHTSFTYLFSWLGIDVVAALEPKPGIPPTASHLESVLKSIEDQKVAAVFLAPFEDRKAASWLSEKAGLPVTVLPFTVGGNENADSLSALFEESLRLLAEMSQ